MLKKPVSRPRRPRPIPPGRIVRGSMIVVSKDQHGNRVWLQQDGTWTSDYAERGKWDSLPALEESKAKAGHAGEVCKDPDYVTP